MDLNSPRVGVRSSSATVSAFQRSSDCPVLRKRWRKVLYQRQPFADNHVDESFLAQLVTNANVVEKDYFIEVYAKHVGLIYKQAIHLEQDLKAH